MAQAGPDKSSILDLDNSKLSEQREQPDPGNRAAGFKGRNPEFAELEVAARQLRNLAAVLRAAGEDTITRSRSRTATAITTRARPGLARRIVAADLADESCLASSPMPPIVRMMPVPGMPMPVVPAMPPPPNCIDGVDSRARGADLFACYVDFARLLLVSLLLNRIVAMSQ
jgi:hypothetical protein